MKLTKSQYIKIIDHLVNTSIIEKRLDKHTSAQIHDFMLDKKHSRVPPFTTKIRVIDTVYVNMSEWLSMFYSIDESERKISAIGNHLTNYIEQVTFKDLKNLEPKELKIIPCDKESKLKIVIEHLETQEQYQNRMKLCADVAYYQQYIPVVDKFNEDHSKLFNTLKMIYGAK